MYNINLFNTNNLIYITFSKYNIFINIIKYYKFNNNLIKPFLIYNVSLGYFGFKGKQKYTPFALNIICYKILLKLISLKIYNINLIFKGTNNYKYIILKILLKYLYEKNYKLKISSLSDLTNISYNYNKFK